MIWGFLSVLVLLVLGFLVTRWWGGGLLPSLDSMHEEEEDELEAEGCDRFILVWKSISVCVVCVFFCWAFFFFIVISLFN